MYADYNVRTGRRWALLFALLLAAAAHAAASLVPAGDLSADAREAARLNAPILVFYAEDGCSYCRTVEDLYLEPMQAGGQYAGRLLIRVVHTRRRAAMRDFAGRETSHAAFAASRGVNFTPAVHLYDAEGRDLVAPLVGYTTPDFYAGYLESAIERAQDVLVDRTGRACAGPVRAPRC
jgi:thioredoxin-related protein